MFTLRPWLACCNTSLAVLSSLAIVFRYFRWHVTGHSATHGKAAADSDGLERVSILPEGEGLRGHSAVTFWGSLCVHHRRAARQSELQSGIGD